MTEISRCSLSQVSDCGREAKSTRSVNPKMYERRRNLNGSKKSRLGIDAGAGKGPGLLKVVVVGYLPKASRT